MKRAGWRSSISLPDESGSIAKMGWRVVAKSGSEALLYRSEEHTSELQSHSDLVCRLLLEKKKPTRLGANAHAWREAPTTLSQVLLQGQLPDCGPVRAIARATATLA